jgi:molecular chaperone GrpE (heat shock protein)
MWLRRLLKKRLEVPELPAETGLTGALPAWAAALADAAQKSARAQARLTLQVEDLERKLEGGLAELRNALGVLQKGLASGAHAGGAPPWDELLDALDLLDEAIRLVDPAFVPGLMGVVARLGSFLSHAGLTRLAPLGHPPDGRLFRVVGTEPHSSLVEGSIARVVRAAVLQGEHLLREGEAITVRNSP